MLHNKPPQNIPSYLLGPIKIKDGLFIGDHFAAKDIEFIISNKVTHIINTVVKTLPNLYEKYGIQYLSVHWSEKEENIFDKKGNALNAIFSFIEETVETGESCLIHSNFGKSRSFAVLAAYLMRKYRWSLDKCLEFAKNKKEGLEIRNNFIVQLREVEKKIKGEGELTIGWRQISNEEDLLLTNTLLNSKKLEKVQDSNKVTSKKRVVWPEKIVNRTAVTTQTSKHKELLKVKSILKGEKEEESEEVPSIELTPQTKEMTPQNKIVNQMGRAINVNNFIQTDKKTTEEPPNRFLSRPFSSDTKEREPKNPLLNSKINNFSASVTNPYEFKMASRVNSAKPKKAEPRQIQPTTGINERPLSAKIAERRPIKPVSNPLAEKLGGDLGVQGPIKLKRFGAVREERK